MTTALVSKEFVGRFGDEFTAVAGRSGKSVAFMTLPEEQGARLINIVRGKPMFNVRHVS